MTDGYGGVLIQTHSNDRFADQHRTADHGDFFPKEIDLIVLQGRSDAASRSRHDGSFPALEPALHIERSQGIDVFFRIDRFNDSFAVELDWERQLHDDAMDAFVGIAFLDYGDQFCL